MMPSSAHCGTWNGMTMARSGGSPAAMDTSSFCCSPWPVGGAYTTSTPISSCTDSNRLASSTQPWPSTPPNRL